MIDNFAHRANDWDSPAKIQMADVFVSEMLKKIQPQLSWKVLEIGAGTGLVGLQILPLVQAVVFEDTSEAMLEVLRSKLLGNETVELLKGEVTDYLQQDIDCVFSLMAFHHIPNLEAVLQHLASITKPNGMVVIGDLVTEDGSFHRFEPIPHRGFDMKLLSSQFSKVGFVIESAEIYHVLKRERTESVITNYEQFMLVARRV